MSNFYDSLKKTFAVVLRTYVFQVPAKGLILDIGCGMGQLTHFVHKYLHRETYGIDIDLAPLRLASTQHQELDPNSRFVLFDGNHFPFTEKRFEMVFAHEVIEHVPQVEAFIKEMHRLLKSEGLMIVSTPNANLQPYSERAHPDHVKHYTPSELEDLLTSCGFSIVEICFRRHTVATLIDRILLKLARKNQGWKEVQPHMRHYSTDGQMNLTRILLRMYQSLADPIVTWIEQTEFRLKKKQEGPSMIVVCRKG